MIKFEPYLHVTDDGYIWWPLKDAIRLGVGYRPFADDHAVLESELRAPNQRARANERTLIGAFSDARLKIEQPMTFERDGIRYVDASAFLTWLSQYIAQTQAKIAFPDDLARAVRHAKAQVASSSTTNTSKEFESLTLALEAWFDHALAALPDKLRDRVKHEFLPPWDALAPAQRRSVALQYDYQRDPATLVERKFCWDFYQRTNAIEQQLAACETAAALTSSDLALKEARLKELRQELAQMALQERQAGSDYYPVRVADVDEAPATPPASPPRYMAYPKAMGLLAKRLGATPEELAAWVFYGREIGGLAAFLNGNELDPPPPFDYCLCVGSGDNSDYTSPLMGCWFREDEIAQFEPAERYITGKALIARWSKLPGIQPQAFIRAKITESRFMDMHPITGLTRGSNPEDTTRPPLEMALFNLAHVEAIEAEDFGVDEESGEPVDMPKAETESVEPLALAVSGSPCNIFIAMEKLDASELSFAFIGDKSETGLAANNMVELCARNETRRVTLGVLELVDRRRGSVNSQGVILLGMAQKMPLIRTEKNAATMTRLRKVFRDHLGIMTDPFETYRQVAGWVPRFKITDRRGAADERAKREAERRTDSYEQLIERGERFADTSQADRSFDDGNDDADEWLKNNDPNAAP